MTDQQDLRARLLAEADAWDSWNVDHPKTAVWTTPPLLREAVAQLGRVGEPEYDREVIADMLGNYLHGLVTDAIDNAGQYLPDAVAEQIDLLRAADNRDAAGVHTASATPQPDSAAPGGCSCPSGDGSLRWPCSQHPPGGDVEQTLATILTDLNELGGLASLNHLHPDVSVGIKVGRLRELVSALSAPKQVGVMAYPTGSDREVLEYLMQQFDAESWVCGRCGHEEETASMDSADYLRKYLATHPASQQAAPVPVEGEGREVTVSVGGLMNVPAERAAQQMRENAKVMDTRHRFLQGVHGGKGDPTDGHIANLLRTGADALDRLAATPPPSRPAVELWKFVERAFDSSKTSTSERLLEDLGLPSDNSHMPLSWHINRALALIDGAKK